VRRLNLAMAVYTIALSIGFMLAFPLIGAMVLTRGWRAAWWMIGFALLAGLAPLALLLVRRSPESCSIEPDGEPAKRSQVLPTDYTLSEALATPSFWVFGISSAIYGLIASGIALFNESILAERRFDASTYHRSLIIVALTSLVGNFLGGWIASKWKMNRLLSLAMILLAGSLVALPHVSTQLHVAIYAAVMGFAGGFVIVIFFSFWSAAYGRKHLGKIQGAAQAMTVIASALGPLVLAETHSRTGSYASVFYLLTVAVVVLALLAWFVKAPVRDH
jgi:predicted MFS family arabinose efflux permease